MSELAGSPEEAARRLGVSPNFVRELIRKNQIPYVRLNTRKIIIPWRALEDWLNEQAASSVKSSVDPPALGLVADAGQ